MVSGRFVTFCFVWVDPVRRIVSYANAGHNPPLLVHADGTIDRLAQGGMVLGIFPENRYDEAVLPMAPGDRLLLYTDGITEARNAAGEEFGDDRLGEVAVRARTRPADAMKDYVMQEVQAFTSGAFDDDATLIVAAIL